MARCLVIRFCPKLLNQANFISHMSSLPYRGSLTTIDIVKVLSWSDKDIPVQCCNDPGKDLSWFWAIDCWICSPLPVSVIWLVIKSFAILGSGGKERSYEVVSKEKNQLLQKQSSSMGKFNNAYRFLYSFIASISTLWNFESRVFLMQEQWHMLRIKICPNYSNHIPVYCDTQLAEWDKKH